jgi:hypothetical protein
MRMPGFNAEQSLTRSETYYSTWNKTAQMGGVRPAQSFLDLVINPCSYCIRNCTKQGNQAADCRESCRFGGLCDI